SPHQNQQRDLLGPFVPASFLGSRGATIYIVAWELRPRGPFSEWASVPTDLGPDGGAGVPLSMTVMSVVESGVRLVGEVAGESADNWGYVVCSVCGPSVLGVRDLKTLAQQLPIISNPRPKKSIVGRLSLRATACG
ncbi:Protein translocase subunit SecA 2, partial [Dissostichus eleginoides]